MWTKTIKPDVHVNEYGSPDAILNISLSTQPFPDRPILGFGAAFTEASSLNYQSLSEAGKKTLMELYFGKSGLGYALGRVHINSCDFSIKSYNFDDVDGDFDLQHFDMNVTHDNQPDGMMDMIRRATSVLRTGWSPSDVNNNTMADGTLLMYASPWSPPAWMKNPLPTDAIDATHAENMTGSTTPSCLREGTGKHSKYAKAWALYFSKFITACTFDSMFIYFPNAKALTLRNFFPIYRPQEWSSLMGSHGTERTGIPRSMGSLFLHTQGASRLCCLPLGASVARGSSGCQAVHV
jgi:hypothetical protein